MVVSGEPSFRSGDEAKEHGSERLAKGMVEGLAVRSSSSAVRLLGLKV